MELEKMKVGELLDSEEFKKELEIQIRNEQEHHDHMMREAFLRGLRLQRNPINSLIERGVFNSDDIREMYRLIICKALEGFSSSEREYIKRLCLVTYWRTVEKIKKKEKETG